MMYRLVVLFCVILFCGCGATKLKETNISNIESINPTVTENNSIEEKTKDTTLSSNTEEVFRIMSYLASDDLQGRDSGSEGIEKAAVFIENEFKENGIAPYFLTYRDTISNFKKSAYNIVGYLEGNDPELKKEFLIIGAHYDHIGQIPGTTDVIANGANDNASGTATVVEIARYFGNSKKNKRSILFVLFTAEEKGLLGSKHLAKRLKKENFNLYTMLNFEMVGVPLIGKDYLMYVTGYESSNLAEVGNTYAKEKLIGFLPKAKEFNLFKRSDNFPFHQEFNVPSQTFCTFDFTNFNHYHKVGDEVELIDFNHMVNVINKSIPMIEAIANSTTKEIKY